MIKNRIDNIIRQFINIYPEAGTLKETREVIYPLIERYLKSFFIELERDIVSKREQQKEEK